MHYRNAAKNSKFHFGNENSDAPNLQFWVQSLVVHPYQTTCGFVATRFDRPPSVKPAKCEKVGAWSKYATPAVFTIHGPACKKLGKGRRFKIKGDGFTYGVTKRNTKRPAEVQKHWPRQQFPASRPPGVQGTGRTPVR